MFSMGDRTRVFLCNGLIVGFPRSRVWKIDCPAIIIILVQSELVRVQKCVTAIRLARGKYSLPKRIHLIHNVNTGQPI